MIHYFCPNCGKKGVRYHPVPYGRNECCYCNWPDTNPLPGAAKICLLGTSPIVVRRGIFESEVK